MLFSIITICFNDLNGLSRTYNSLRYQFLEDYEWVVIDGASKDGTAKWLSQLDEPKLNWSSEPDKGIFDAMNKGLVRSTGEYLIYMNSGDEFNGNDILQKIKDSISRCEKKPYYIYGDAIDITKENKSFLKLARDYTYNYKTMFTSHQAMLFNREFGVKHNIIYPPQYKYTSDYAYISLYLKNIDDPTRILKLDFPVCRFLLGGTNEIYRYKAIKEDYKIRTQIMEINKLSALSLFLQHFIHTYLKQKFPKMTKQLRYKKT